MINLTVKQFSDINLYNNKNSEEVISSLISESANGILVSVFDDKIILFDNIEEEFYSADYSFSKEEFIVENFEKIILTRDKDSFNENIKKFFNKEADIEDVLESYENIFSEQESMLTEEINSNLLSKQSEFIFFNDILKAKKELNLSDFNKTKIYEEYIKRYNEKPSEHIYYFDWENPTKVSLYVNETKEIYVTTNKEKAKDLWKEEGFRETLVKDLTEETINDKLEEILFEYKVLNVLKESEFKEIISKSILMENVEDGLNLIKNIMEVYRKELSEIIKENVERYNLNEEDSDENTEKPYLPTEKELESMEELLNELNEKIESEEAKCFLSKIINEVSIMKKENAIDPEMLKDIVRLLSEAKKEEKKEKKEYKCSECGKTWKTAFCLKCRKKIGEKEEEKKEQKRGKGEK
jgi:hypothetical protein